MNLKELRQQSGKRVAGVASELNISPRTLYSYEEGSRSIGIDKAILLAKIYDVSIEDVISAQAKSILVGKSD